MRDIQPPAPWPILTLTQLVCITTAYEQGYGKGITQSKLGNPYAEKTNEHEAWAIGYAEGLIHS